MPYFGDWKYIAGQFRIRYNINYLGSLLPPCQMNAQSDRNVSDFYFPSGKTERSWVTLRLTITDGYVNAIVFALSLQNIHSLCLLIKYPEIYIVFFFYNTQCAITNNKLFVAFPLLRQLSYDIKKQLKAPKDISCLSLWHKVRE